MSLTSLSKKQVQLLLGTLLGDGSMTFTKNTEKAGYASRHGWKQHPYNYLKYQILAEFVTTLPAKRKNYGYGKWSSVFATTLQSQFWFIKNLCYWENSEGRIVKQVRRRWLELITARGLAWWVCDDGSLDARHAQLTLHTEGFSRKMVYRLQRWLLRAFEIEARVYRIKSRSQNFDHYWHLKLTQAGTARMIELIRPYVPECMLYKITPLPRVTSLTCFWCGGIYKPSGRGQRIMVSVIEAATAKPCCQDSECIRQRHLAANEAYIEKPGMRESKNLLTRERYLDNLETERERGKRRFQELKKLPAKHAKHNEDRQRRRAEKAAARSPRKITCTRCQTEFETEVHAKVKFCGPICKKAANDESKRKSALTHPRSSTSNTPVNEMFGI